MKKYKYINKKAGERKINRKGGIREIMNERLK
jgi:hypothetical protein